MRLNELNKGMTAVIDAVEGEGGLRQHMLDMGVIPGVEITFIKYAPMGDPMQFRIHGYELTLRKDEAKKIVVSPAEKKEGSGKKQEKRTERKTQHPGLGEEGRFHKKGSGNPVPEGTTLTFALVGNQNCGKTTLFNRLTG